MKTKQLGSPNLEPWWEIERDPAETTAESHCYVSRRHRQPIQPIPQMVLDANTVLVSCGMTNYESTGYTDGRQQKFRNHLGDRKVEVEHLKKHPNDENFLGIFQEELSRTMSRPRHLHRWLHRIWESWTWSPTQITPWRSSHYTQKHSGIAKVRNYQ